MANHKSAIKRIRSNDAKRLRNKYQHKTTRNAIRKLRAASDKKEAETLFPAVASMIDKLAKRNIIHSKKAANLKSGLQVMINKMESVYINDIYGALLPLFLYFHLPVY